MSHKKQEIKVEKLLLNEKNPRFPSVENQEKALDMMLTQIGPKIKKLATDIAQNGLDPGASLYVMKENKKYIVLEGNRRLTAIKLIHNHMLTSNDGDKKFFQKLPKEKIPLKLNCIVFSNKTDAEHWINLRHTGENQGIGTVSWDSEQQKRFRSQISGSYPKVIQILDFIAKHNIKYSHEKYTIIEKLISTPYVREQIGIDFKKIKEGGKELKLMQNEKNVVSNLKKVIKKIDDPNFSPDRIYSAGKRKEWIDAVLNKQRPKNTSKVEKRGNNKTKKQKSSQKTLIPPGFELNISQERIKLIYEELQSLNVDKYKNAVAVLFRVFLELSVDHFIKKKKKEIDINSKNQLSLNQKLKEVITYMEKNNILVRNELKAIRIEISNQHGLFSTNTFNSYVHNLDHIPRSNDLIITWKNQSKFIKKLWE